jgi:DNA-binding response OmpR family regulator
MKTSEPTQQPAQHILIVEDEPKMRGLLEDNLEFEGFRVTSVESAEEALARMERQSYALIILDVMLPRMSGFEFCRQVRARGSRVPVIMLTARTEEADRVIGLDLGADDYVSKPFSVRELMARVRAQLRRDSPAPDAGEFVFGDVKVNLRSRIVTRRGKRLEISPREFELLRYLIGHRGEVVSREQLLRDVWGYSHLSVTRTVDNYIFKLRAHLEPKPHDPRYIVTVHGSGYHFVV